MRFTWLVALRFLREGGSQSVLIVGGVAVGVAVMIFLSALISGLQQNLVAQTLSIQPHVTVRVADDEARPQLDRAELAVTARVERPAQRLRTIANWTQVAATVAAVPGVRAVAPTVSGAAFALRAEAERAVVLRGVEPDSFERVVPVSQKMSAGDFRLGGTEVVVGRALADELGVAVGDKLRLANAAGDSATFTISGLFDLRNQAVNESWVFVSLRAAQTLLGVSGDISELEVTVTEVFEASAAAAEIAERTGLVAESWMTKNQQLLIALRSQSSSSGMIQFFVILAVALGIASVLVVSVVQKSREIGILRAMGARAGAVMRVFIIEGFLVGLAGSLIGIALGAGLALFFARLAQNPDGSATFPIDLNLGLYLRSTAIACVTGVLAALAPARRAARLDPAVVIRNG